MVSQVSVISKSSMPLLTDKVGQGWGLISHWAGIDCSEAKVWYNRARIQANITRKQQEQGQAKIQLDARCQPHSPVCTQEKTRNSLQ